MKIIALSRRPSSMSLYIIKFLRKRKKNQKEVEEDDLYIHKHYIKAIIDYYYDIFLRTNHSFAFVTSP